MGRKLLKWNEWSPGLDTDDMTVREVMATMPRSDPDDVPDDDGVPDDEAKPSAELRLPSGPWPAAGFLSVASPLKSLS